MISVHLKYKKKISTLQEKKNVSNLSTDLIEAVKKRTISDVPYGTFLSSGIDSALVTSILSKNCGTNNKVQTFSIGIEGDSFLDETMPNLYTSSGGEAVLAGMALQLQQEI